MSVHSPQTLRRRSILILLILLCLIPFTGRHVQGLEPPKWTLNRTDTIAIHCMIMNITTTGEIIPDAADMTRFTVYLERVEEFLQRFEEEREEREQAYNRAGQKEKIAAALELIQFIIRARREWDSLSDATLAGLHCRGEVRQEFQLDMCGMGSIAGTVQFTMELEITSEAGTHPTLSGGGDISGRITGGSADCGLGMGTETLGSILEGQYNSSYSETPFTGHTFGDELWLDLPGSINGITNVQVIGGMGGFGGASWGTAVTQDGTTTMDIEAVAVATPGHIIAHDRETKTRTNTGTWTTRFTSDWQVDEPEFQRLLDQYFGWYVKSIDSYWSKEFEACGSDYQRRMDNALRALNELLRAELIGEQAGVSPEAIDQAGLAPYHAGSLYDKWYEKWFSSGLEYWRLRTEGGASLGDLKGRRDFLIQALDYVDYIRPSQSALRSLQVYQGSELMDTWFESYFDPGMADWCAGLRDGSKNLDDALIWLSDQQLAAALMISAEMEQNLGLSSGGAAATLHEAAEVNQ